MAVPLAVSMTLPTGPPMTVVTTPAGVALATPSARRASLAATATRAVPVVTMAVPLALPRAVAPAIAT